MHTVLRALPALGIVAYIVLREVLDRTSDLAWLPKVAISMAVGVAITVAFVQLRDRLAPRFAPDGAEPAVDDPRRR